jgi:hypothetical protein
MLAPCRNGDVALSVDCISDDETVLVKLVEKRVYITVVPRQCLNFDRLRPITQTALTVGNRPKSGEEQPTKRLHLSEFVVEKEARLDTANARHSLTSP